MSNSPVQRSATQRGPSHRPGQVVSVHFVHLDTLNPRRVRKVWRTGKDGRRLPAFEAQVDTKERPGLVLYVIRRAKRKQYLLLKCLSPNRDPDRSPYFDAGQCIDSGHQTWIEIDQVHNYPDNLVRDYVRKGDLLTRDGCLRPVIALALFRELETRSKIDRTVLQAAFALGNREALSASSEQEPDPSGGHHGGPEDDSRRSNL